MNNLSISKFLEILFLIFRIKKWPSKMSQKDLQTKVVKEKESVVNTLVSKTAISDTPRTENVVDNIFLKELPQGEYWKEEHSKEIIVLHFTAGYNWKSAYDAFMGPGRVATPFIVDKEGPKYIVKLFDEKYWSYHLGIKEAEYSKNWANDKRSIGIEVVNIGPVWFKDGVWKDYVGKEWLVDDIVQGKNRDADGGVKFPEEQIKAVCDLINYLCDKWNIPREVPKDKMSFQLPQMGEFKGIVTHQMFRQDKYDMGIAWPWEKVTGACNLKEV